MIVVALGLAVAEGTGRLEASDLGAFDRAGLRLLSGEWATAFADSWIQVGPITLALAGGVAALADAVGAGRYLIAALIVYPALALATMEVARVLIRDRGEERPGLELAVGLSVLFGGLAFVALASGHPAEAAIALLWVLAGRAALRERPLAAGILLALAAGLKAWAVLGVPLLLLAPSWRARAGAGAVAAGATALMYGPFFVVGEVATFEAVWAVTDRSLLSLVVDPGSRFTWPMRLGQSVVVLGVGAALAGWFRRSVDAPWAVALGLVAARIVTDPLALDYYWLAAQTIALVALAVVLPRSGAIAGAGLVVVFYATCYAVFMPEWLQVYGRLAACIALLAYAAKLSSGRSLSASAPAR